MFPEDTVFHHLSRSLNCTALEAEAKIGDDDFIPHPLLMYTRIVLAQFSLNGCEKGESIERPGWQNCRFVAMLSQSRLLVVQFRWETRAPGGGRRPGVKAEINNGLRRGGGRPCPNSPPPCSQVLRLQELCSCFCISSQPRSVTAHPAGCGTQDGAVFPRSWPRAMSSPLSGT